MRTSDSMGYAGSPPNQGEVVRGLRLLTTTQSKDATLGTTIRWYLNPCDLAVWTTLTVVDADSGVQFASRRFSKPRYAKRARRDFVTSVTRLPADDATTDWQALLDSARTTR